MSIAPGTRLRSQVCTTEVIVIRGGDAALECGGEPMIPIADTPAPGLEPKQGWTGGASVGKRFTDGAGTLEVLVTKGGAGALGAGGERLVEKGAKPLPSSD